MNTLKETIEDKTNVVIRQNEMRWDEKRRGLNILVQSVQQMEEELFSYDEVLQTKGLHGYRGLLLLRPWDDIDDNSFGIINKNKDTFKDKYVDDFNNFSEFYEFLKGLVNDVEEYHDARINNLDDKEN